MAGGSVLVTGAAGVMGIRLVRALVDGGWKVRGLVLPGDPGRGALEALGCEVREGDVGVRESLDHLCDGMGAVIHMAAVIIAHDPRVLDRVNLQGTVHVAEAACASGVRHFVYVSSASVTYPRRTPYAESKLAAERVVAAARSFEHTIVRPTLAYDESGGLEVTMFLDYLRRFPVVPFVGAGRARKRPVWTGDIVSGLLRVVDNPVCYGKTYNFSGGEAIAIADLAHALLEHHGADRPFVSIPVPLCRAMAKLLGTFMRSPPLTQSAIAGVIYDADLDPSEATRDLGYRPIGVREGLRLHVPTPERTLGRALGSTSPKPPLPIKG